MAYTMMTKGRSKVGQALKAENVLMRAKQQTRKSMTKKLKYVFIEKKLLLLFIGFLLGRAVILYNISPFAIALVATAWAAQQKRLYTLNAFILIGALTYSVEQATFILLATIVFLIQGR